MKTYEIIVDRTQSVMVTVEAETLDEAKQKAVDFVDDESEWSYPEYDTWCPDEE